MNNNNELTKRARAPTLIRFGRKSRCKRRLFSSAADIAVYRDLTWKIGFRIIAIVLGADARQFRLVRSPIHFNVINVPIACFVS